MEAQAGHHPPQCPPHSSSHPTNHHMSHHTMTAQSSHSLHSSSHHTGHYRTAAPGHQQAGIIDQAWSDAALADGSSYVCSQCGGVVPHARRLQHEQSWCPATSVRQQ
jgi:hypothetical protein